MKIDFSKLNFQFHDKPLLIGGMAMEYYGLRKAGADIDFVISAADHARLWQQYPENRKELWCDLGVCVDVFEIWDSICLFDYDALTPGAVDAGDFLVISLEKLLLLKALAMKVPKYHKDLELIVERISNNQYGALFSPKHQAYPSPRFFAARWQLDPAQSAYQNGAPPAAGIYDIAYDGHQLHFTMEWTTADGREMKQEYDAIPNSLEHALENHVAVDSTCFTVVDPSTLDSTASREGKVIAYARRVLSQDGASMTVTQSGERPDGTHFDNVSVYVRS